VDSSVSSDNFFQGEAFEHTFNETGNFPMFCTLHGNPGSGMIGQVTVVEDTEENVAQFAAQPVVDIVPPTPTPPPPVPLAPPALIEPPTPGDTVLGILAFRDNVSPGDSVTLAMGGVDIVPEGSELHAWLIADDDLVTDIGRIEPDSGGNLSFTYTDPKRQNLMALFDGVQISIEPENDADPLPGQVIYSGRQAPDAYRGIRLITAGSDDTPRNNGYGVGARLQAEEVIRHAQYIQLARDLGSIADAQRHAEHVINILEGESGDLYGDWSGAHGLQNPGDGFGLIPYIREMQEAARAAAAADDATNAIQIHAMHVVYATDNALEWATTVRDAAFGIIESASVGDIGQEVETINGFSLRLLLGEDRNGDGAIAPDEGGIFTGYQHAQYMGAIGIIAGDAAGVVEPLIAPGLENQIAAGEIVIDMLDFEFGFSSITVPAGTKVRFVNRGQSRHSATADDDTFDTGLLDPGQEITITMDEPGFFPYYCVLHGTRGGVGMAASITVVEAGAEVPIVPTVSAAATTVLAPTLSPTPALEPTLAETLAAPTEETLPAGIRIDMIDFSYSDLSPTIKAGSTVTWFNAGNFKHSATADDGTWDTTLLDPGVEASITFDKPGVYPYFCTLHGAAGGIGMAATITVTD
jgi:plastocyanin